MEMSAISNFTAGRHALIGAALRESFPIVGSEKHSRLKMRISRSLDKV